MNRLVVYPAPKEAKKNNDFTVRVRQGRGNWQSLFVYEVKVDMHNVRKASMAYFDMDGKVEVEIMCNDMDVNSVMIRPKSKKIAFEHRENVITFELDNPTKLSIEVNDDRFHNLHLFANSIEEKCPDTNDSNVMVVSPGIHRTEDILRIMNERNANIIYFSPGMHYIEQAVFSIPSGKTIYLAGGSIVVGSLVCHSVKDITIRGRGILYLSNFERFSAFRAIRILFSQNIKVEGITVIDPPHYSIYIGKSSNIKITNFKSFSTRGWSDGIDMMSSSDIEIKDVFMRNSDDCIAIYGSRWDYFGDTRNVRVADSILWADVAHPIMIGTHGNHKESGDTIENLYFENIDILEHHEPQENYWGALAINAGDMNFIQNITFDNIRVENFELGLLIDIRVIFNKDYNPAPGNKVKNINFNNIEYNGDERKLIRILGYDKQRIVEDVTFRKLTINGEIISDINRIDSEKNEFVNRIYFI